MTAVEPIKAMLGIPPALLKRLKHRRAAAAVRYKPAAWNTPRAVEAIETIDTIWVSPKYSTLGIPPALLKRLKLIPTTRVSVSLL